MSEHYFSSYFPNRTLCGVLDEMRKLNETRNYAPLLSLIEELQVMGNRMEAGLSDLKDHKSLLEDISKLKRELKDLRKQKKELKNDAEVSE